MNELLTTGSVLAAFLAGGVALFAPCCIVFLAPSYLAIAIKNRRWRLLPLTFVFAAGLAAVLVPITLGMSLLAGAIAQYHTLLYALGGILMLLLAAWSLTGRMWSLPSFLRAPDTRGGDSASFFALGVFSGVASACCAPVLVGVMTLSALSGSAIGGTVLGLAYVFGMVFPLLVMALLWDRYDLGSKRFMQARPVTLPLPRGKRLHAYGTSAEACTPACPGTASWSSTPRACSAGTGSTRSMWRDPTELLDIAKTQLAA